MGRIRLWNSITQHYTFQNKAKLEALKGLKSHIKIINIQKQTQSAKLETILSMRNSSCLSIPWTNEYCRYVEIQ